MYEVFWDSFVMKTLNKIELNSIYSILSCIKEQINMREM